MQVDTEVLCVALFAASLYPLYLTLGSSDRSVFSSRTAVLTIRYGRTVRSKTLLGDSCSRSIPLLSVYAWENGDTRRLYHGPPPSLLANAVLKLLLAPQGLNPQTELPFPGLNWENQLCGVDPEVAACGSEVPTGSVGSLPCPGKLGSCQGKPYLYWCTKPSDTPLSQAGEAFFALSWSFAWRGRTDSGQPSGRGPQCAAWRRRKLVFCPMRSCCTVQLVTLVFDRTSGQFFRQRPNLAHIRNTWQ